jgi:Uncharacterized protein conserved in bacteria
MTFLRLFALIFCASISLSACDKKKPAETSTPPQSQTRPAVTPVIAAEKSDAYEEIEWQQLMPKEDLDALMNPPEYLDAIEDGSSDDVLDDKLKMQPDDEDDAYQRALSSTKIIAEYNQRKIRLPGFIVPLDFDDNQVITTFLLVPFFGACIHLPPPPPNQIIFATYEPGLSVDDLSDAFFVEGTIFTEIKESDLATSAYSMTVDRILPYED